jgi:hypothetical protein
MTIATSHAQQTAQDLGTRVYAPAGRSAGMVMSTFVAFTFNGEAMTRVTPAWAHQAHRVLVGSCDMHTGITPYKQAFALKLWAPKLLPAGGEQRLCDPEQCLEC